MRQFKIDIEDKHVLVIMILLTRKHLKMILDDIKLQSKKSQELCSFESGRQETLQYQS